MSGIAGIIRLDGAPVAPGEIEGMLATLARRGPDRRRGWCEGSAAFGQALLATTPEALAETQPWVHPGTGCVVVSDSRLDNRPELLQALELARAPPDEIGDGELLHAAWQRWGEDCAERLLGDFAFVLWDARSQKLFCARDVMGVRPFYYHHAPGRLFAFASEADVLLAVSEVPKQINEGRIADALVQQLEGIDKTSTFFEAILRLPPANVLMLGNGRLDIREYWTPISEPPADLPATEAGWIEGLHEQLTQSVRRRLRANVRVGSMLSGGLDSSSIVAIASELLTVEGRDLLPTFSAVSSEPDCPETRAIESMLAHFDVQPTRLDWKTIPAMLDAVATGWTGMGEPFDACMTLVECQYRAAAEKGVRVLFDGIDADTLLSDGESLQILLRRGHLRSVIREARAQARFYGAGTSVWSILRPALSGNLVPLSLRRLVRRWLTPIQQRGLMRSAFIDRGFATRIHLSDRLRTLEAALRRHDRTSADGRAQTSICSNYTTVGIERYGRVAATHGIEPRHPFMDRQLIEYCAWLPRALQVRDGYPKWALRRAMAGRLPDRVAWRRGKEHLGWRFNYALMGRPGTHLPGPDPEDVSALRGYVDSDFLGQIRSRTDGWAAADERWVSLLLVASLQTWLNGRSGK